MEGEAGGRERREGDESLDYLTAERSNAGGKSLLNMFIDFSNIVVCIHFNMLIT